jgi:hypothetical protein
MKNLALATSGVGWEKVKRLAKLLAKYGVQLMSQAKAF